MAMHGLGTTKTYNRFHNPDETSADMQKLRELHVEMDQAVAADYGWTDLDLGHGFHETKQGVRYTISEAARREVLQRLLKLNHERYAEEEKQGLHGKKGAAKKAAPPKKVANKPAKSTYDSPNWFEDDENEVEPLNTNAPSSSAKKLVDAEPKTKQTTTPPPKHHADEIVAKPKPVEELETEEIMAAFRQAARGRGAMDRDELLKDVSVILGYKRLGPKIVEALRNHLRAAIRRRIIETEGATVRAGTTSMADYDLEELRESFRSVMRKGTSYEREDTIHSLASYLGFSRVTDNSRDSIKSAINSAIRQGILGYDGTTIWREE